MTISYPPLHSLLGLSPHGVLAAAGILAGAMLLLRDVRHRNAPTAPLERAMAWAIPAGIIGARADYVLSHPHEFSSPVAVLQVWQGGLALFGGLIAGLTVGLVAAYRRGFHLPRLLDALAPSLAIAIAIGRFGDLLLLDHLGKPTTSRWAIAYRIPSGATLAPGFEPSPAVPPPAGASCSDLGRFYAGCTYHLSAAYDLIGAALLAALLLWLRRRGRYRAGTAISVFAAWYGLQRLLLDDTRGIDERPLAGLTGTQLLAIAVLAAAAISLMLIRARHRGLDETPTDPPSRKAPLLREPQPHEAPAVGAGIGDR